MYILPNALPFIIHTQGINTSHIDSLPPSKIKVNPSQLTLNKLFKDWENHMTSISFNIKNSKSFRDTFSTSKFLDYIFSACSEFKYEDLLKDVLRAHIRGRGIIFEDNLAGSNLGLLDVDPLEILVIEPIKINSSQDVTTVNILYVGCSKIESTWIEKFFLGTQYNVKIKMLQGCYDCKD